ncbi:MAG: hypothetical protein Q4D76_14405 [Oscillospiraceae bacterium]|nr:hypothetical protein [Oscillospiraceae bacterium]
MKFNRISSEKVIEKIRWKSNGNNQYCFKTVLSLTALERTQTIVQVREKNGSWVQERN